MLNFFASINAKNINLNVDKAKNFDSLQKIDEEIKRIQFKVSDCSCGGEKTDSSYPMQASPAIFSK